MLTVPDLFEAFQYFKKQKHGKPFSLNKSPRVEKQAESFLQFLDERYNLNTIGPQFLWTYMLWMFDYYESLELVASDSITFQMCFSKTGFERYLTRKKQYDWTLSNSIVLSYAKRSAFLLLFEKKEEKQKPKFSFEVSMRLKDYNTDKGLGNCISFSLSYNRNLSICKKCKNRTACKQIS